MTNVRFGRRRAMLAVAAIATALLAVVAIGWLRWTVASPETLVRRMWARHGVDRPNVLLVTLDTTRADHLGCYGDTDAKTPNVDGLAGRGARFAQAATPAPLTLPAHASIMTGLYPAGHGLRLNGTTALSDAQTTLAERFHGRGYRTGAFIGAFVLDARWGLAQGFDTYDDWFDLRKFKRLDLAAVQRPANEVVDAALRWLDGRPNVPFFAWVHLYDAHSPYEPPEPFRTTFAARGPAGLYDAEIAFADQQVGRLLAWVHAQGLDERTMIVIAGDHGEGLGSHGEGTHGYFVYDSSVHVPLIVSTPLVSLQNLRVDAQVSLVDVAPTIAALAGLDPLPRVHGRSLVPLMTSRAGQLRFGGWLGRTVERLAGPIGAGQSVEAATAPGPVYAYSESTTPGLQFGWSALKALRSPRFKFIEAPRPELYDLQADPGETTNVFARHPDVASTMARELERLEQETSRDAPTPEVANLDADTFQRLASLGYVAGVRRPSDDEAGAQSLADPKDKLEVFTAVQRAGEWMAENEHQAAATALESAIRQDPGMTQARLMLGSCYMELGRASDARAQFDGILKEDPENVQALVGLANVLLDQGQDQDVETLCKRTIALDDRNTQAYGLLGEVYIARHEPSKALPYLEKALEIQPKLTQNRLNLAACQIEVHDLARAKTTLDEILETQPRFPGARFNLGLLYEEQGRPELARQEYEAEIAAHPDTFKARFNLGKIKAGANDWVGCAAEMREVIRVAPRRPEGYLFLARALLHGATPVGDVQSIAEKGLSLARMPAAKALGWYLLADVYSRQHQADKVTLALRHARQAQSQVATTGDEARATRKE